MKKLIYSSLTLAIGAMVLFACQKEEDSAIAEANFQTETEMSKEKGINQKTTYTEFEQMAMAANIDEIDFDGTSYQISFHDATPDYTVDINSFNDTVAIDFDITTRSTTNNVDIDVVNEGIDIQNVGSYTFTQFEDYEISSTADMFENLTVIMTVHHRMTPNTDKTFIHNGTSDTFSPDTTQTAWIFWGKRCSKVGNPYWYTNSAGAEVCGRDNNCKRWRFGISIGSTDVVEVGCSAQETINLINGVYD